MLLVLHFYDNGKSNAPPSTIAWALTTPKSTIKNSQTNLHSRLQLCLPHTNLSTFHTILNIYYCDNKTHELWCQCDCYVDEETKLNLLLCCDFDPYIIYMDKEATCS